VRCLGYHTNNKGQLPTSDLPWAQVTQSITSAANDQVGESPTGLMVDSWVIGFFIDGNDGQQPIIIGSIAGIPGNEPDTSRLARNDLDFPPNNPSDKDSGRTISVSTAGGGSWNEPASAYNAEYPHNHVRQTESGHIQELDDTPGNERIHEYHKSGTFYEIDSQGNKVTRIVGDEYEVVAGNDYVNVKGNVNFTIDGNCNTKIAGNWNVEVDGNYDVQVGGNVTEDISGERTTTVSAIQETISGNKLINTTGIFDVNSFQINKVGEGVSSRGVSLDYHTHSQGPDSHGDSEVETDSPTPSTTLVDVNSIF